MKTTAIGFVLVLCCAASLPAQDHADHHSAVDKRGDQVMGFSHEKTTHHFRLYKDGGAIEVEANSGEDSASIAEIRKHLGHIATMFADGNFRAPMLVHNQTPPGVPVMQQRKKLMEWKYRELKQGASVEVRTADKEALAALHQFLQFQISDHRTGDSQTITSRSR